MALTSSTQIIFVPKYRKGRCGRANITTTELDMDNDWIVDTGATNKANSGFIVPKDIPSNSWLRRGIDFEPNRHGIKPGRHWDGINRSNGREKQLSLRANEKKAIERKAYLWSISDM
ncbi:hypothetical protein RND81_09G164800 [Saponaria officinalis]|uniref:Uncharacterized protein n=1 Tax=Saponaria officinalis TaxID=3572 RepID=A0AAW1IMM9_SAPOF